MKSQGLVVYSKYRLGNTNVVYTSGNASALVRDGVAIAVAEDGGRAIAIARQPSPVTFYYDPPVAKSSNSKLLHTLGGIYIVASLWTLLITALIGSIINDADGGTPSSIKYCMFVAVLSWIVLITGMVMSGFEASSGGILDGVAILFVFVAAVVLSAKLGIHNCSNDVRPNLHD